MPATVRTTTLVRELLSNSRPEFVSFVYTNRAGELARHTVTVGASIHSLYERDVQLLRAMLPAVTGTWRVATQALLASRELSLEVGIGNHPDNVNRNTYDHLPSGLLMHRESGEVYVHALRVAKKVYVPGSYTERRSSALVASKRLILANLPSGRLRQFDLGLVEVARLRGNHLILQSPKAIIR